MHPSPVAEDGVDGEREVAHGRADHAFSPPQVRDPLSLRQINRFVKKKGFTV
jgi:hypothetical protein